MNVINEVNTILNKYETLTHSCIDELTAYLTSTIPKRPRGRPQVKPPVIRREKRGRPKIYFTEEDKARQREKNQACKNAYSKRYRGISQKLTSLREPGKECQKTLLVSSVFPVMN